MPIKGFEDETHELTKEEIELLAIIVPKISRNIGKQRAVTNERIRDFLSKEGHKVQPSRIRQLMHYIRVNRLVKNLIATSRGYYRAETQQEIDDYVESLYQRANSIIEVAKSYG
jgi:hypothetical protein